MHTKPPAALDAMNGRQDMPSRALILLCGSMSGKAIGHQGLWLVGFHTCLLAREAYWHSPSSQQLHPSCTAPGNCVIKYPYKPSCPRAGTLVAVKVRHPGVGQAIQRDFALMMRVARLASLLPLTAHLRLEDTLSQFAAPLREQARPAALPLMPIVALHSTG